MGVYKTTKCGYCNDTWEFFYPLSDESLGPPIIKCVKCYHLNKTKSKLFREMNEKEQNWIKFKNDTLFFIINTIIILFGIVMMWGLLGIEVENRSYIGTLIVLSIPGSIIFGSIKRIVKHQPLNEIVSELEKEYDNNGGFLYSNQWYRK